MFKVIIILDISYDIADIITCKLMPENFVKIKQKYL